MKKVLLTATVGGFVPQFEQNNVRLLKEFGCEIHYASNFRDASYGFKNEQLNELGIIPHQIDFVRSPFLLGKNLRAYAQLRKLLKEEQFTLIHCHTPMGAALTRLAAAESRKHSELPVLYTAHGFHFYKKAPLLSWLFYYPAECFLARRTDVLITINREDYHYAKAMMKDSGKAEWIPGVGLPESAFKAGQRTQETKVQLRRRLGIPEDCFFVLNAAELTKNKNQKVLLQAAVCLKDFKIVWGICGDGKCRGILEKKIHSMKLTEKVKLFGYCPNLEDYLRCADCFAFPSRREGLGMAALEAMAAGLCLVTSDCRGTREYMENGKTGFVCWKNRPQEYTAAIQKLYENRELGKSMGSYNRKKAELFSYRQTEARMKRIYGSILKTGHFESKKTTEKAELDAETKEDLPRPVVSVIMGSYNPKSREKLFQAVNSIRNQSFTDWEFLICDDGSDPVPAQWLRACTKLDPRIRLIRNPINRGLAASLNRCLQAAHGRLIARMDDDDYSLPTRLEEQYRYLMEHPNVGYVSSNILTENENRRITQIKYPEEPALKDFLRFSPFVHPALMMRREVYQKAGGYQEGLRTQRCEDYDLFLRLFAKNVKGVNLQQNLLLYRSGSGLGYYPSFRFRIREFEIRWKGFLKLGCPLWEVLWYSLRPILAGLLPEGLRKILKKCTLKSGENIHGDLSELPVDLESIRSAAGGCAVPAAKCTGGGRSSGNSGFDSIN